MTLTIELPAETVRRLRQEAERRGVSPPDVAAGLIDTGLPPPTDPPVGQGIAAADLFARWAAEDVTDDPAEVTRRAAEFDDGKQGMNAASTRGYPIFP